MENILNLRNKFVEKLSEEKLNDYEKYKKDEKKIITISAGVSLISAFIFYMSFFLVMIYEDFKMIHAIIFAISEIILCGVFIGYIKNKHEKFFENKNLNLIKVLKEEKIDLNEKETKELFNLLKIENKGIDINLFDFFDELNKKCYEYEKCDINDKIKLLKNEMVK